MLPRHGSGWRFTPPSAHFFNVRRAGKQRLTHTHPHDGNMSSFIAAGQVKAILCGDSVFREHITTGNKCTLYNNSNNGKPSCYSNDWCNIKQWNKWKNLCKSLRSLVCKSRSIKDLFIDRSPQTQAKIAL